MARLLLSRALTQEPHLSPEQLVERLMAKIPRRLSPKNLGLRAARASNQDEDSGLQKLKRRATPDARMSEWKHWISCKRPRARCRTELFLGGNGCPWLGECLRTCQGT